MTMKALACGHDAAIFPGQARAKCEKTWQHQYGSCTSQSIGIRKRWIRQWKGSRAIGAGGCVQCISDDEHFPVVL